jgi:hypothetical protein
MFTVAINTVIKVDNNSYNFKDVVTMLGCEDKSDYAEEMYRKLRYLYKTPGGALYGAMYPDDEPDLDCSNIIPLSLVMGGCVNLGKL